MKKFREFIIYKPQEPPTKSEIEEIESFLGAKLPFEFVEFLNYANGGVMNYCVEIAQINDILSFCSIFSTKKLNSYGTKHETFIHEIFECREIFKTPKEVLPFAIDGGGSLLFLDLTKGGKSRVVAFVHGLPEWTGRLGEDNFIEIAPNFENYLQMLFECDDLE